MISEYYSKIRKGLLALIALIIVFLPDVVIELVSELLHVVWELVLEFSHILFEGIESGLDNMVEGLFETDLHNTQIIVFYIIMMPVFYVFYRLARKIPGLLLGIKNRLQASFEKQKIRIAIYWLNLTRIEKLKVIAIGSAIILYYALFAF